jgi:hypothetical protein
MQTQRKYQVTAKGATELTINPRKAFKVFSQWKREGREDLTLYKHSSEGGKSCFFTQRLLVS